jgi:hypothetical protein
LLARLIAEHFALAGIPHAIFDTDPVDRRIAAFFPGKTTVVDLERVPDQMKLFDSLASPMRVTQVIDLSHRSFGKFFAQMRDIDYVAEARAGGIEPVIFYIPDIDAGSYEQAATLREQLREASFVLVRNEALGEPSRDTTRTASFAAFASHVPRMTLPRLDPFFFSAIADTRLSLSTFMRRSLAHEPPSQMAPEQMSIAYLSREARSAITAWLRTAFNEIRRALQEAEQQRQSVSHERPTI